MLRFKNPSSGLRPPSPARGEGANHAGSRASLRDAEAGQAARFIRWNRPAKLWLLATEGGSYVWRSLKVNVQSMFRALSARSIASRLFLFAAFWSATILFVAGLGLSALNARFSEA